MRQTGRVFPALLIATAALLPVGAEARAVCEQLRQALSSSSVTIASNRQSRRFAETINQLNRDIRQIRSDLRRAGCSSGSITVYGGDNEAFCAAAEDDLHRAEMTKRGMLERRASLDSGDRGDILAALRRNGCMDEDMAGQEPPDPMPDDIMASRDSEIEDDRGYGMRDFGAIERQPDDMLRLDGQLKGPEPMVGNLRTLCVRTCDGGFFPISSNATPADFSRDAATCARMCPGTQTELYYHSMLDQEMSDMISTATGQPYKELSTAFAYRNRKDTKSSTCSCNLNAYYQDALKKQDSGVVPMPSQKPEAKAERSVTRIPTGTEATEPGITPPANPEAGSSAKITLPEERPYDPSKSKIRQVGPQFLGSDSAGIDLKNPQGSMVQPQQ